MLEAEIKYFKHDKLPLLKQEFESKSKLIRPALQANLASIERRLLNSNKLSKLKARALLQDIYKFETCLHNASACNN